MNGQDAFVLLLLRLPIGFRGAVLFAVCILFSTWCFKKSDDLGVYHVGFGERRYQAVGEFVGRRLPANAALLTVIQSGSIRLYANRATLRWDEVPADKLDRTIATLRSNGYTPYILLEDWEEPMFRARFGAASDMGRVDWPPAMECYGAVTVRIYDPEDRKRHIAGERWLPQVIPRG